MVQLDPNQTTHGSATSVSARRPAPSLALCWLFPKPNGPELDLGPNGPLEAVIGRDDCCDIVLGGSEISRRHAVVRRDGSLVTITDLGSRNGTYVNGHREPLASLKRGDVVRLGDWVGIVECPGPHLSLAPGLFAGPQLRSALEPAQQAAESLLPILLEGETGTGKEVVAHAIHSWSGRKGALVPVNCAALPEALAEGELFGYRRGAFTGAERESPGYIRNAHGGTLFLDEICELSLVLQAKLLRFLEQREVQPLGEARPIVVDVRVIAAAQEPLAQAVREGRFRGDLFARLETITVRLPSLRERRNDIPGLFMRALAEKCAAAPLAVDAKLVERLCLYDWPFNVRELVRLAERLAVLHGKECHLKIRHLPPRFLPPEVEGDAELPPPAKVDVEALVAVLRAAGGNVSRAAQALGISRQRAYRMLREKPDVEIDLASLRSRESQDPVLPGAGDESNEGSDPTRPPRH
jgi:hypothetical protein